MNYNAGLDDENISNRSPIKTIKEGSRKYRYREARPLSPADRAERVEKLAAFYEEEMKRLGIPTIYEVEDDENDKEIYS